MLPDIQKPSRIQRVTQSQFGGYDRREGAAEGTFYDTGNLTTDRFPLLAARPRRWFRATASMPQTVNGVYGHDTALVVVWNGNRIYYNDWELARTTLSGTKQICGFGDRAVIWPDKALLDLRHKLLGRIAAGGSLPADAQEGDAWAMDGTDADNPEIWLYTGGAWQKQGPALQYLEREVCVQSLHVLSGTYQSEYARLNTLYADGVDWAQYFKVGDAVSISGCTKQPANNQTIIVREISGQELRFYENSFRLPAQLVHNVTQTLPAASGGTGFAWYEIAGTDPAPEKKYFTLTEDALVGDTLFVLTDETGAPAWINHVRDGIPLTQRNLSAQRPAGADPAYRKLLAFEQEEPTAETGYTEDGPVTVARRVPELELVFGDDNRLWGVTGSTIYASKLGDPANFYFFDGTSEDSWALDVQSPGAFTGAISHDGYPTFFKEDKRYKVYGTRPSNYQLSELDTEGVIQGGAKTLAIVGNVLYYMSRSGIMADTGAVPSLCSQALGLRQFAAGGAAGADAHKYWVWIPNDETVGELFCYDTRSGIWMLDNGTKVEQFALAGGTLYGAVGNRVWAMSAPADTTGWTLEPSFGSYAETNDYTQEDLNRKRIHRILLRGEIEEGSQLTVMVKYDSQSAWRTVWKLTAATKRQWYLPVRLRRCDHFRLRLEGRGSWCVHALGLETRHDSAVH